MTWRCTAPPSATARCSSASAIGTRSAGTCMYDLCAHAPLSAPAPERQPLEVALHPPRVRRELRDPLEHRERGVSATTGVAERGAVPTRTAAEVGRALPAVCGPTNGAERRRDRPLLLRDPRVAFAS